MSTSRPNSSAMVPPPLNTSLSIPPSLEEILANTATPPWTLSAFMAYLSQNHCLETLEFTMDADRYKTAYNEILQGQATWMRDSVEHVCSLWRKLMNAYITPYGAREVNLPAHVRDHLLSLSSHNSPPKPSELDEAVKIVNELMNDSLLVPFLESVSIAHTPSHEEEPHDRLGQARLRIPKDSVASPVETSRSPKTGFLPMLSMSRTSEAHRSMSSSTEPVDREMGLSEDTGSAGSPNSEPMTPPTTPPTADWAFSNTATGSSSGLSRALSVHSSGWKKLSGKLGLGRKHKRAKPSNVTSGVAGSDAQMGESSQAGGAGGSGAASSSSGSASSSRNPL